MTDRDALLRSILERPDDDVRRLVMADWLEENGESERAEFIRVQIQAARCEVCHGKRTFHYGDYLCHNCQPYYDRERELWSAVESQFARPNWQTMILNDRLGTVPEELVGTVATVRRGFISTVRCTLAEWAGEWERREFRRNNGTSENVEVIYNHAHGPRIVAEQPVERVWTEKRPQGSGNRWHWMREVDNAHPCSNGLPWVIFDLLSGFDLHEGSFKDYPTEFAAQSAISLALVNWARREAGLPPLPQETR